MEDVFSTFFSAQTLLLCLGIYVLVFVLRKITEAAWPALKEHRWHRELMLPLMPIFVGALLGIVMIAWTPEAVGTTPGARGLYGAICGTFSSLVYGRFKSWIKSRPGAP